MSLKSIEMQIALPRTQDAGKQQEQLQQRGQLNNDFASQSVQKEVQQKRTGVIKQEQKDVTRFHKDEHGNSQDGDSQKKKKKKQQEEAKENHPYKGTVIDYSG